MHDRNELRCTRCGKLCPKPSSLKRHDYYCRSKPLVQPKSRKRSCEACTRAKIRCDATFPSCLSCASRKIACQYVGHALPNLAYLSNDQDDSLVLRAPVNNDLAFDTTVNPLALNVESGLETNFEFNLLSAIGSENSLNPAATPASSGSQLDPATLGTENFAIFPVEHIYSRPVSPISLQWKPPKLLGRRTADSPQAQMATMMLAQIIASFPYMMIRKETFPPFIHPRCYDYSSGNSELSEILMNCMELSHMFHTKKRESDKVFWRSIRMEQERLYAQYETFSTHDLLAATQAILIYTTMRLIDGTSEFDNIEIPLLHSLNTISGRLGRRVEMTEDRVSLYHGEQHWQEWILYESQRRVVAMARIMNTAFSMDRAFSCECLEGYSLLPLPSSKVAWETKDELIWTAEHDHCLLARSLHGLTSDGKLVRLHQTAKGIESKEVGWQRWLASQDGFGIMVMLAAQLLG